MKNTTKITVWCISKYASPPKYGVGAKLYYLSKKLCDMEMDVLLIASDSNHLAKYPETKKIYNHESFGALKYIWIKTLKYKKSASLKRILSWFDFEIKLFLMNRSKLRRPDVVVVSSLSLFTILYGIFLKKKYGAKLIFEVRDIHPLTLVAECGISRWNPIIILMSKIEKLGYKKADLITGTMPNLKEHVREILGSEKDTFHSPLGIHEVWDNPCRTSTIVDSLFSEKQSFVVGYAGSMGISNALQPFMDTIKNLSGRSDISFVLVGDGDLKPRIIEELGEFTNVRIGPRISQKEIPCFLNKCDILYLSVYDSAVWKYGQSMNKLVDYMMAGKPIIASYNGYQSMINEADCGLFIPVGSSSAIGEAILFFKNMPDDERKATGLRGKDWVLKHLDYKHLAEQFHEQILVLMGQSTR